MSERANRMVNVEAQRCPRRAESYGMADVRFPGPDHWQRGRWAATQEESDAEVADFMTAHPTGSIGHVLWSYGGEQPRTCSYCGGIHPDDAIALVRAGWYVDATDKGYKRYLEPPGTREHRRAMDAWWKGGREGDMPKAAHPSPVPPVKLYVQHFTPEQIDAFNAALPLPPGA